jgi:hypothetical protein
MNPNEIVTSGLLSDKFAQMCEFNCGHSSEREHTAVFQKSALVFEAELETMESIAPYDVL